MLNIFQIHQNFCVNCLPYLWMPNHVRAQTANAQIKVNFRLHNVLIVFDICRFSSVSMSASHELNSTNLYAVLALLKPVQERSCWWMWDAELQKMLKHTWMRNVGRARTTCNYQAKASIFKSYEFQLNHKWVLHGHVFAARRRNCWRVEVFPSDFNIPFGGQRKYQWSNF